VIWVVVCKTHRSYVLRLRTRFLYTIQILRHLDIFLILMWIQWNRNFKHVLLGKHILLCGHIRDARIAQQGRSNRHTQVPTAYGLRRGTVWHCGACARHGLHLLVTLTTLLSCAVLPVFDIAWRTTVTPSTRTDFHSRLDWGITTTTFSPPSKGCSSGGHFLFMLLMVLSRSYSPYSGEHFSPLGTLFLSVFVI
jgi:hypothetical protein